MGGLLLDLRLAARQLARRPGLTASALAALALGIGVNTTLFSVVEAVLLRPLPYLAPERLVVLREASPERGRELDQVAPESFLDWRARSRSFSHLAAWTPWGHALTGGGDPVEVPSVRASAGLLPLLGVRPALGRAFLPEEETPGRDRVAVLGHALWRDRFGADPRVVGRAVVLDGAPFTVVGVMPAGFRFPAGEEIGLWVPLAFGSDEIRSRARRSFNVLGRLAPGVSLEEARAEMGEIARRLGAEHPATNAGWGIDVAAGGEVAVGALRQPLLVLLGAVGLVLLIACANVASLSLARAAERQREIAVRASLGASRPRLVRQLLAESALLAGAGAAAGLLLATWGIDLVTALDPGALPRWNEVRIDARVLAFTAAAALATVLLAGLAPALHASRPNLGASLRGGSGGSATSGKRRAFDALVVSEVALAMVLLVGAGLLVRSLLRLHAEDPGFQPDRLLAAAVYLPESRYPEDARQVAFFEGLVERARTLPGARAAAAVSALPMNRVGIDYDLGFSVVGRPAPPTAEEPQADFRIATPGYFAAMGIPLLAGRDFDRRDRPEAPLVAVVNQTMARRFLGGAGVVGERLRIYGGRRELEVVGVVGDVRHRGLDAEPRPELYVPLGQTVHGGMTLVVRTAGEPAALAAEVRRQVLALDPDQTITAMATVPELIAGSVAPRRFRLFLLGSLAALALVLAAVGIFGVVAYAAGRRTREIGLRMAVGARRADVLLLVTGQGLRLAAFGVALGTAASLGLTRLLERWLYEVSPADAPTYAGAALLFLAVATAASALPARRAARIDPVEALRHD